MPRMPSRFFCSLRFSFSSRAISFFDSDLVAAVGGHRLEVAQPREAALDGREVGEQAAEPALVHEEHAAALRFFGDRVLRLPLGADEQDRLALGGEVA